MSSKLIVTHSGSFHPDDLLAVTVIKALCERAGDTVEILRSRKTEDWERADYVVDVGTLYEPENGRFDHHQIGGAGTRENGIKYSSFGIVWKHFGLEYVNGDKEIWQKVDKKLVEPVDALDNGQEIVESKYVDVHPYTFFDVLHLYRPLWHEKDRTFDQGFLEALPFAKRVLDREIEAEKSRIVARDLVHKYLEQRSDKRLLVMDEYLPIHPDIFENDPELLLVAYPDGDKWSLKTVRKNPTTFQARMDLPISWAGKRDQELQEITGVSDAIFCHNGRFIAGAKSKEGVLALAKLALQN